VIWFAIALRLTVAGGCVVVDFPCMGEVCGYAICVDD